MGKLIEEWKNIQGYEGLYQISNLENVKNKNSKLLKPFKKGKYGHAPVGLSKGNFYSEKNKEKLMKERGKQVLQWENGRVIAFYESLKDAGRKTGISWVNIRNVCNGEYKHAGGYEWSYACKPYDMEKVVKQIKEMFGCDPMYYGTEAKWAVDKAIEIVKAGSVE